MRASYAFVLQKNNAEVSTYSVLTPTFIIEPIKSTNSLFRLRGCFVTAPFIIVFRLVCDIVAKHKTTRYAGTATKVIQKNHLA